MIQKTLLLIFIMFLSSCASIFTRRHYDVKVTSNALLAKIQIADSIYELPAKIQIKRSKYDLPIKLITDSVHKNFIIKPSPNPTFVFANLLWTEFCPIAYLIDLSSQKRFYYGKSIYLDIHDTTSILEPLIFKNVHLNYSKNLPVHKDQIFLSVSLPVINNFYLQPTNEPIKFNTGFGGFSAGIDYYYSDTKFINVSGSFVSNLLIPAPKVINTFGQYKLINSLYSSFTHNHKLKKFYLGYGLNFSSNYWEFRNLDNAIPSPTIKEPISMSSLSFGITTNAYYQIGKQFFTGLTYRPTFLRFDNKFEYNYEHLVSVDFGWKIKLK